ncbi:MAG TPA: nucleoside hydrolase [Bryobacteraceae bacterium]|nr:nucleoside hydrolase [Bryobacteraceae bacterium]
MQFPQGKPPAGVVFDSDLGNGIDDALALALLYGLDGRNEARVVCLSISKSNLKAAAFCDAVSRFYSGGGPFFRPLPIGLADDGRMAEDTPMLTVPLARKDASGAPVHKHGIERIIDTADPAAVIRNAFTAQHDGNAIVVLTGPATNLARVLELQGVKDLISRKVRYLCVAAGAFPEGGPEANIRGDVRAAKKLFAEWPTPIVASGQEIGNGLLFPGGSIETDFAWSPAHPIAEAYRAYKPMPYDAPTWAMSAVLHAVRPQEGYFRLSDPGTVTILDDGGTRFTAGSEGRHRHLILDPAQRERIVRTYTEIASAKPVPRMQRFRPPQQQQQQPPAQPPKPAEAKPPSSR